MIENVIARIREKIKWTKNTKHLTDKEKFVLLLKNLDRKIKFKVVPDGIYIDPFEIDGRVCDDFFVSFYEDGKFQEFKIYLNQEEIIDANKKRETDNQRTV